MLSLHFVEALLPGGWARDVRVTCHHGMISDILPNTAARPEDSCHAVGLPGLPNLHSHAFQRGMAGLSETRGPASDNFWTWREVMYRFLGAMTPEDIEAVTAQAYVEMLEGGFTRVGEFHYLHNDINGRPYAAIGELAARIGAAASLAGIGLTLLPVFYAHGNFGGVEPVHGQRRFITDLDSFARLLDASADIMRGLPGATLGVAPHSLRAATPQEIDIVTTLLPDAPVHMHIAEQVREVEDCLAWSSARPVQWLLDHVNIDPRWCLIHATHMTQAETIALARTGAVAGLCPITEANLGDGIFNGPTWIGTGGRYGIGTDSNILIDAAQELRQFEYAQRLGLRGRNLMAGDRPGSSTGAALFCAALQGGSQALGVVGAGLQVGASADLVTLRTDTPALQHRSGDGLLDSWIFAGTSNLIDCVWVRGHQRVAGGRHLMRDSVAARYAGTLRRLLSA